MFISYIRKDDWPELAWFATCKTESKEILVSVGGGVETRNDWCCEAVWNGAYADGSFDLTDVVAGTGIRLRDGKATFVSSGSTVDRLVVARLGDETYISNSLCCLLSQIKAKPCTTYPHYHRDFHSITRGIRTYEKHIPSTKCDVGLVYFDNILWDGESLCAIEKPEKGRKFDAFSEYYEFMLGCMQRVAENACNVARRRPFALLATLSSGYDSATAAALAQKAGCKEAVSFSDSRGGHADSGGVVAQHLGLQLTLLRRDDFKKHPDSEVFIYCGEGEGEESFIGALTGKLRGKVLLTGFHGDKVWDRDTKYLSSEIVRGDATGLSLTEWRLREGFLHCPVPFWSCRSIKSIAAISMQADMARWDLRNIYNRPICRRVLETEGVPREGFGMTKRATAHTFYESKEVLMPSNAKDYSGWIIKNRSLWLKEGKVPPTLILDRVAYSFYTTRADVVGILMRLSGKLPVLWRAQKLLVRLREKWIIENCPPSKYRGHIAQWAIERVMLYYQ